MKVKGKVAVITGAADGIGLGAARAFSAAGIKLLLADINETRLAAAVRELREEGAEAHGTPTDVRSRKSLELLLDTTLSKYGGVHILVNNAGGPIPRQTRNVTAADWARALDLNFFSVVSGVQVFLPYFEEQGEGHLCATASMSGLVPFPPVVTYNVAKAATIAFMETLARELRQESSPVRVSVLCPGEVATHGVEHAVGLALAEGHEATSAELEVASAAQAGLLKRGIHPDRVGRQLLEGILADRFWIFTHPDWVEGPLKKRHAAMMEDGSLIEL